MMARRHVLDPKARGASTVAGEDVALPKVQSNHYVRECRQIVTFGVLVFYWRRCFSFGVRGASSTYPVDVLTIFFTLGFTSVP